MTTDQGEPSAKLVRWLGSRMTVEDPQEHIPRPGLATIRLPTPSSLIPRQRGVLHRCVLECVPLPPSVAFCLRSPAGPTPCRRVGQGGRAGLLWCEDSSASGE